MLRIVTSLFAPLALLLLALVIYPAINNLADEQFLASKFLPVVIAIVTLALSFRFNRSRIFFSMLSLLIAYTTLLWYIPQSGQAISASAYQALALLLPFNLLIFSLLKERGMFSWWGMGRFMFLLVQLGLVLIFLHVYPEQLAEVLNYRFFNTDQLAWTALMQPALLMILVVFLIMNGRLFSQLAVQNTALFGAMIAAILMLHLKNDAAASIAFSSAAMLILCIAVIQDSYSIAYIDQLTNLPGRRALNEQLLKLGNNYCIAMLDVDHFKKFNDTHGHDTGDEVLRMIASRISHVGSGGKTFRYGGEEFSILFPGKDISEVIDSLNKVRETIASSGFDQRRNDRRHASTTVKQKGNQHLKVTISIGVATRNDKLTRPADVLRAADKALYRAKKQGRNRVCK